MPKIEKKVRNIIAVASFLAATAIILFGYFTVGSTTALDDYIFFGLVALISPIAAANYIDYRWRKAIDAHLPDLFKNIVQAEEVGMTLHQAIDDASKRDYGPLTSELKKMTVQISWGFSFEETLVAFGKRVGTVMMQRILPMIIEASRSGGHVEKVFDPLGKFLQTNNMLEKERKTQTRPYVIVIYVGLFVFLFTIVLLFKTFFASAAGVPLMAGQATPPEDMKRIFLHMTLIQGFFGGLVAGKMGEGSVTPGLKHSLVMMLLGFLALKLFM
jgi:flagellar protein FlaJ